MSIVRSFIAVNLDSSTVNSISSIIKELSGTAADVKWVRDENLHITLKFLGDVDEDRLKSSIFKKLVDSLNEDKFVIKINGLGVFPSYKRPKVVWVGIKEGSNKLKKIHSRIEKSLLKFNFTRDNRAYIPHITIGRIKSQKRCKKLIKKIKSYSFLPAAFMDVECVSLMKSELHSDGPVYTVLKKITLK